MKHKILKNVLTRMAITLLLLMGGQVYAQNVAWDHANIVYGADDPARQFLKIYLADAAESAPVHFFSHAKGGTANGYPQDQADTLHAKGDTLVSWESATPLASIEEIETSMSDAQIAFDWLRTNAPTYNIDPDCIVVAGGSRSMMNW